MDIIGKKFLMLTVLEKTDSFVLPSGQTNTAYLCKCDCGNIVKCRKVHLVRLKIPSCGCARFYGGKLEAKTENQKIRTLWRSIMHRCNGISGDVKNYSERGIRMCDEWENSYKKFETWCLDNGYREDKQIDRIDNNLGYEPNNCRFLSPIQNARNKRNSIIIEYNGEKMHWKDLLDKHFSHLNEGTVYARLKNGWSVSEAFETPKVKHGKNRFGGNTVVKTRPQ